MNRRDVLKIISMTALGGAIRFEQPLLVPFSDDKGRGPLSRTVKLLLLHDRQVTKLDVNYESYRRTSIVLGSYLNVPPPGEYTHAGIELPDGRRRWVALPVAHRVLVIDSINLSVELHLS